MKDKNNSNYNNNDIDISKYESDKELYKIILVFVLIACVYFIGLLLLYFNEYGFVVNNRLIPNVLCCITTFILLFTWYIQYKKCCDIINDKLGINVKKHKNLKCSCCGFIPDFNDIVRTGYHLMDCDCGQDNVCDLCLTSDDSGIKFACPKCSGSEARGKNRKVLLKDEYLD